MIDVRRMIVIAAPDEHERGVLERIVADHDHRANDALNAIGKTLEEIWRLIRLCVQAEMRARTFRDLLADERKTVERLQSYRQSVEDLRGFLNEVARPSDHPLIDWKPDANAADRAALDHIAALINERALVAEEARHRLGVTRKSSAADTAAIGWLADAVKSSTGKPFTPQVAVLAEIALDIGEVLPDRVREALRSRQRLDEPFDEHVLGDANLRAAFEAREHLFAERIAAWLKLVRSTE
ncbi:MAG: hypothetical protein ACLP0B_14960 [Steroidobacteraceae bacterium]